jgi:hypothetical protein
LRPRRLEAAVFAFLLVTGVVVGAAAHVASTFGGGNVSVLVGGLVAGAVSGGLAGRVGSSYRGRAPGAVAAAVAFGLALCLASGIAVSVLHGWTGVLVFGSIVLSIAFLLDSVQAHARITVFLARHTRASVVAGVRVGLWTSAELGIALSLAIGIAFGAADTSDGELASWLLRGALFGTVIGTAYVVAESGRPIGKPSRVLTDDLGFAGAVGVMTGLASGVAGGTAFGLVFGVVGGAVGALSIWAALAVATRFAIACPILAKRRLLPLRLASFLDWAYAAGLLRISGVACQFRHIELQDWATRQPH